MKALTPVSCSYWPEPVRIMLRSESPLGFLTVEAVGVETGHHYTSTLPSAAWDGALPAASSTLSFLAKPAEFALALESRRLQLAHSYDPLLAANNALVHLVPHQVEAVYGVMLPQPVIRLNRVANGTYHHCTVRNMPRSICRE